MGANLNHHHGGPIELHTHVVVPKQYHGLEELSQRTYPFAPSFFIAQLTRIGVVMAILCSVFILGPLMLVNSTVGAGSAALLFTLLIYGILLTLYALYLNIWMKRESFKFSLNYIDVCEGVFRQKEQRVLYSEIRHARVRQDMFERLGNIARVEIDHDITGTILGGDQSSVIRIVGLSMNQARTLAHIINTIAHPEKYAQKK